MSRARHTAEQGAALVWRYEASGMTQARFAEREGVSVNTLQYWIRKVRGTANEEVRFVEVVAEAPTSQAVCSVSLLGDVEVRFSELPPPEYLVALAGELRGDD